MEFQPLRSEHWRWRAGRALDDQLIRTGWGRARVSRRIRELHGSLLSIDEQLCPAEDNRVSAPTVWIWELYAPSQVGHLESWLKRIEARSAQRLFREASSVLNARRTIGFRNQGSRQGPLLITKQAAKNYLSMGGHQVTELPPGVEQAWPLISVVPGGLTVLTVGLFYDEHSRNELDALIRQDWEPRITPTRGGGHSLLPASRVQEEAIDGFFRSRLEEGHAWLKGLAPGALAAYGRPQDLRCISLVTHQTEIQRGPHGRVPGWFSNLDLNEGSRGWHSTTMPLTLAPAGSLGAQLIGIEQPVRTFEVTQVPAPDPPKVNSWNGTMAGIDRRVAPIVVAAAIDNLIDIYADGLGRLRDLPAHQRDSPSQVFKRLRKLRQEIQILVDVRATMTNLAARGMDDYLWPTYDGGEWRSPNGKAEHLHSWLSEVPDAAASILALEEQIRERLKLEADLLSTSASVRSQRRAFIVALVALAVAAFGIYERRDPSAAEPPPAAPQQIEHDRARLRPLLVELRGA